MVPIESAYATSYLSLITMDVSSTVLADRTNGRAYATVLRLSVRLSVCPSVRLWRYVLWLNGAS